MHKDQRGFIQVVIILGLIIVILSLLGISIGGIFENKTLKENFSYLFKWAEVAWNYIYPAVKIAWDILQNLIWEPLLRTADKIKN